MEITEESQQLVRSQPKKKRLAVRSSTEIEDDLMLSDCSSLNDSNSDGTLQSNNDLKQENRQHSIESDEGSQELALPIEIEENLVKWQLIEIFQG